MKYYKVNVTSKFIDIDSFDIYCQTETESKLFNKNKIINDLEHEYIINSIDEVQENKIPKYWRQFSDCVPCAIKVYKI